MSRPRVGDVVIGANMTQWRVIEHDGRSVVVESGRKRRSIDVELLECLDHDDGLWQEMVRNA